MRFHTASASSRHCAQPSESLESGQGASGEFVDAQQSRASARRRHACPGSRPGCARGHTVLCSVLDKLAAATDPLTPEEMSLPIGMSKEELLAYGEQSRRELREQRNDFRIWLPALLRLHFFALGAVFVLWLGWRRSFGSSKK